MNRSLWTLMHASRRRGSHWPRFSIVSIYGVYRANPTGRRLFQNAFLAQILKSQQTLALHSKSKRAQTLSECVPGKELARPQLPELDAQEVVFTRQVT